MVLGELLGFLRNNNLESELQVCRKIENLRISNGLVKILLTDDALNGVFENSQAKSFFEQRGLGIALIDSNRADDEQTLQKITGGKLVIK